MTSPGRSDQGPAVPPLRRVDPNPSGTLAADSEVNCHPPRPERERARGATINAGDPATDFALHVVRTQCRLIPAHRGSPPPSPATLLVGAPSPRSPRSAMSA